VRFLIGSLADGMQPGEILGSYPQLTEDDLLAALAYAADVPAATSPRSRRVFPS